MPLCRFFLITRPQNHKKKKTCHAKHTHTQVAICLGALTSLPVRRSAEGKVTHLQHLSLLLYTHGSYLCRSPFTFHADSFSLINAQKSIPVFPQMNLTCVSESSLPSPSTSQSVCHPGPLSQGDPAPNPHYRSGPGPY